MLKSKIEARVGGTDRPEQNYAEGSTMRHPKSVDSGSTKSRTNAELNNKYNEGKEFLFSSKRRSSPSLIKEEKNSQEKLKYEENQQSVYVNVIKDLDNKTYILKNNFEKISSDYKMLKDKNDEEELINKEKIEKMQSEVIMWKEKYTELVNKKGKLSDEFEDHYKKELDLLNNENKKIKWEATKKLEEMDNRYQSVCEDLKRSNFEHETIVKKNSNMVKEYKNTTMKAVTSYDNLCNLFNSGFKEIIVQVKICLILS